MNKTYYLASFQKSGNTWISFIIANIYNQLIRKFEEIDFFNIHKINPEFTLREQREPLYKNLPWIYTTHSYFIDLFENVILIIRNPWDVMYSYYHYLRGERLENISLSELILDKKRGIGSLLDQNQSYITRCKNLLIITYERMQKKPLKEVKKILDFLDLDVNEKIIKDAILKASFKSMRQIELKKGRKYGTPGFIFTRSGKVGEGKMAIKKSKELDDHILNEIKKSPLHYLIYG